MTPLQAAADTAEKSSGASDLQIAWVGIGGVIAGALFGLLGTWITTRQNARLTKQAELRRLYADLFETLGAAATYRLEDKIIDELLQKFYDEVGNDNPTRAEIEALGGDNVEKFSALQASQKDTSRALLQAINKLEHLKYQARLLAPADTALVVQARIDASRKSAWAEVLNNALVVFARRDLASGLDRVRTGKSVRDIKRDADFRLAMVDHKAFTKS
ncbi:hypothetical protein [Aeromicrobium fastidiosum]|uniref:Uncharacterized protein n=1 Tax=Aeromicrobium fastidiosum TaxID=52699 RepID=A0A641APG9_9ACTN|nr:hypothetical protein [Aeromicrobium fastidiosum]KAA1378766.1 hypothetical protein ESP62_010575 [Aeromicrobium fastidiosum]MBP2392241.1 hypothetical protein [Aeromicrobium fastidiosum]